MDGTRKKIIFKFLGGPKDGETLFGRMGGQGQADRYYMLTNHGRLGQRFRTASEYAVETLAREQLAEEQPHGFQQHVYEIADCFEDEEKVFIRAQYVQSAGPRDAG
jgi:hypothetical protein